MTLTSKTQAVNTMLRGAGYRQTSILTGSVPREVDMAISTLDEIDIEIQLEGWAFNTEREVSYVPSVVDGQIALGTDIMFIDGSPGRSENSKVDIVQRGQNLFDRETNSMTFAGEVFCDQVKRLNWDQIPEPVKRFITIRATRRFTDDMQGEHGTHLYKESDEARAHRRARSLDSRNRDTTIKNLPAVDLRTSVLGSGRIRH